MSKQKRRAPKQRTVKPILNRYTSSIFTGRKLANAIMDYVQLSHPSKLGTELPIYIGKKNVQKILNSGATKIENFGKLPVFPSINFHKDIILSASIISSGSETLNKFLNIKSRFESELIKSNFEKCNELLDDLKSETGESFWYIKNRLLTLYYSSSSEEMQDFCDEISNKAENEFIKYLLKALILTTQSNSPIPNLKAGVEDVIKDLQKNGQIEAPDLIKIMLIPPSMWDSEPKLSSIYFIQLLPVIDQYNLIVGLIKNWDTNSKEINSVIQYFLKIVSLKINDSTLSKLQNQIDKGQLTELDQKTTNILEFYGSEEYDKTISLIKDELNATGNVKHYLNIAAKCHCHTNTPSTLYNSPVWEKLINNLVEIYNLSPKTIRARDELLESQIRFLGTPLFYATELATGLAIPYQFSESGLKGIAKRSLVGETHSLPLTESIAISGHNIFIPSYQFKKVTEIKAQRFLRRSQGGPISINKIHNNFLLKDKLEKQVSILMTYDDEYLINYCAEQLAENDKSFISFPMKRIVSSIEKNLLCSRGAVVSCYFYDKYISNDSGTLLNETFEEYLFSEDVDRPSELLKIRELSLDRQDLIFFKDICSLENMDFLATFQSSDELRQERLEIIGSLYEKSIINKDEYSSEADNILNQFVLDSAASSFERSRIYVDEATIRKNIKQEIDTLFEMYRYSTKSSGEEKILIFNHDSEEISQTLVSGGKSDLLLKIIDTVIESFLYNENYGLDSNLSTEIRHGFYSNFLRSEAENSKLLTEQDESGAYKTNYYWHEKYQHILTKEALILLDEILSDFSKQFNEVIEKSQQWMMVTINSADPNALFDYSIILDDYQELKEIAESSKTSAPLVDQVFKILWEQTYLALTTIREKINVDLKHEIFRSFSLIENRIQHDIGINAFSELQETISNAKNNTQKIIEDISEWFNVNTEMEFPEQTIDQIIDVAINCLEKFRGHSTKVHKKIDPNLADLKLESILVKKLILALVNIFENCIKHSGYDRNAAISINVCKIHCRWNIVVFNPLSSASVKYLTQDFIDRLNTRIRSTESIELLRAEGGSGLAKSFHHLATVNPSFDLSVSVLDNQFTARISYD